MEDKTLDHVKKSIEEFSINPLVADFLYLIADNTLNDKADKDNKNKLVRSLFKEGFEIHDPTGTKKIGSKVLQQAVWRVMSKVKFLETNIHGTGKDENTERLVTEGVMTVAKRGGLSEMFGGKGGVMMNAFLFGDGYLMFGKGENDDNPVAFRVIRNEDLYYDAYANGVRGTRPANQIVVIHEYSLGKAYDMFPGLKENNIWGRIPGSYQVQDDNRARKDIDVVEIAWGWNKAKKQFVQFAGVQGYEIDRFEGDEYPAIKNNKAYIPVFGFMCQPSEREFHNYGIGEMLYDLAVMTAKLLNMEVGHLAENTYPITLINAPQSKVDELVQKMAIASKARENGMTPFVAMEFGQGGSAVQSQSLLTNNLFNEWNVVWDRLGKEFSRLGINLDDVERGSGITRGQVIAEEQASNAFVQQMQEYNGTETEELIESVMDAITEYVSVNNKSPLNLLTRLMMPDGTSLKLDKDITMGMLSKELKDGNWFALADKRTGAIPSDLTKMIHEEKLLSMSQPGTPEFAELKRRIAMRMGSDMSLPVPQAPQGGGAPSPEMQQTEEGQMPVPQPSPNQRVLPAPTGDLMTPV